jgi:hypothetical protein
MNANADTATGWTAWTRDSRGWRELLTRDTEEAALHDALDAGWAVVLAILPAGIHPDAALPPRRRRL